MFGNPLFTSRRKANFVHMVSQNSVFFNGDIYDTNKNSSILSSNQKSVENKSIKIIDLQFQPRL